MKCVNPLDVNKRKCAFCGGEVKKQDNGTWKCNHCGFWYDKLVGVKRNRMNPECTGERKLDIAKRIIKDYYNEADCGLFGSRNVCGDRMDNIYDGEFSIDICYSWRYFEVFGLSNKDLNELKKFYYSLDKEVQENNHE